MSTVVHLRSWSRPFIICLLALAPWSEIAAQVPALNGQFVDHVLRDTAGEHKYVVYVPAGYRSDKPSPAILFLHGAGERGKDNRLQLTAGLAPFILGRSTTFPFIVVFPQCEFTDGPILESWNADGPNGRRALLALDEARKSYNFDPKRVILTGWSMGGYGAWSLGIAEPSRWSAVLPVSSGGDLAQVGALKNVPVWAFHGEKDTLVKADAGRTIVDALKQSGGTATFTDVPEGAHDICAAVYGNDAVVSWMQNPQQAATRLGTSSIKPVAVVHVPFVPAVEISDAVGLRLGNDVLDAISHSIPQSLSPNLLNGRLNDMFDSTVASGRQFNIRFGGITYQGQLERVVARGFSKDRLLVQLGIRNVTITIAGTSVTGARHSAQAGPIAIRIGHRYPVWFNLELTPYIADRQIRLRLIGSGFSIPDDNYSVSQPAGVSVRGLFITEEVVSSGLVKGLYAAKGRIEKEVTSIAPRIVEEMERHLTLPDSRSTISQSGSTVSKIWPLPIQSPKFHAWPEKITTDGQGISLIVGVTASSLEPFAPAKTLKRGHAGINFGQVPSDKALHVVLDPNILGPITQIYVDEGQVQLDLLDIPDPSFAKLAERTTLKEIIPDLAQYGDSLKVRSTLKVLRSLSVSAPRQPAKTEGSKPIEFDLPSVQVVISIKTGTDQSEWRPCATFDLDLSEQVQANLEKPSHDQRIIHMDWLSATNATGSGRFVDGYQPKDKTLQADRYVEQFGKAWAAYFAGMKDSSTEVPDLAIGTSKQRMSDVKWLSPIIDVEYQTARIKLSNLSNEPFTYQTKAPTSAWGAPLTLKPGASHEFAIPYPLTYQHKGPTGTEVYTLPVGSHSEFRVPATGGAPRLFAAKRS